MIEFSQFRQQMLRVSRNVVLFKRFSRHNILDAFPMAPCIKGMVLWASDVRRTGYSIILLTSLLSFRGSHPHYDIYISNFCFLFFYSWPYRFHFINVSSVGPPFQMMQHDYSPLSPGPDPEVLAQLDLPGKVQAPLAQIAFQHLRKYFSSTCITFIILFMFTIHHFPFLFCRKRNE